MTGRSSICVHTSPFSVLKSPPDSEATYRRSGLIGLRAIVLARPPFGMFSCFSERVQKRVTSTCASTADATHNTIHVQMTMTALFLFKRFSFQTSGEKRGITEKGATRNYG